MNPYPGAVADNLVLTAFVDRGYATTLVQLAGNNLAITPSILDPDDVPPNGHISPASAFCKSLHHLYRQTNTEIDPRIPHRARFLHSSHLWYPAPLTETELEYSFRFQSSDALRAAVAYNPAYTYKLIDPGEAECAAVAICRGLELLTDDPAIVGIVAALFPNHPVYRTKQLEARALASSMMSTARSTKFPRRSSLVTSGRT